MMLANLYNSKAMIRAVVFDCFGVLTTDAWLPFKKKHFGHDHALAQQATDLNKQVDAGLASYKDFINGVAEMAGISAEQARRDIEDNSANAALFDYIARDLKPSYKIGMLSNAGENWLGDLFAPEQAKLFDAVSLSCDTGFIKPDRRAYQSIADALNVQLEECVMIDDMERFCVEARDIGMQAIVFRNTEQAIRDIARLLGDTKD